LSIMWHFRTKILGSRLKKERSVPAGRVQMLLVQKHPYTSGNTLFKSAQIYTPISNGLATWKEDYFRKCE